MFHSNLRGLGTRLDENGKHRFLVLDVDPSDVS